VYWQAVELLVASYQREVLKLLVLKLAELGVALLAADSQAADFLAFVA
jgi:hypothetical protein